LPLKIVYIISTYLLTLKKSKTNDVFNPLFTNGLFFEINHRLSQSRESITIIISPFSFVREFQTSNRRKTGSISLASSRGFGSSVNQAIPKHNNFRNNIT